MVAIDRRVENQGLVLEAIRSWYEDHSYGPSYRDIENIIKAGGGKISLGTVHSSCAALAERGKITLHENVARSIQIKKGKLGV